MITIDEFVRDSMTDQPELQNLPPEVVGAVAAVMREVLQRVDDRLTVQTMAKGGEKLFSDVERVAYWGGAGAGVNAYTQMLRETGALTDEGHAKLLLAMYRKSV
jgi:hypothetical protein